MKEKSRKQNDSSKLLLQLYHYLDGVERGLLGDNFIQIVDKKSYQVVKELLLISG